MVTIYCVEGWEGVGKEEKKEGVWRAVEGGERKSEGGRGRKRGK